MINTEKYVTVRELTERWRCSRPTVQRYLRRYGVPVTRLGRRPLVPESEVLRIEELQTREVNTAS